MQPLPVHSFAVRPRLEGGAVKAELSWKETPDTLEPTAAAREYILYTRIDDGAFDSGRVIHTTVSSGGRICAETTITPGHIYSYRIAACNSGGKSFPSETLSVGIPAMEDACGDHGRMMLRDSSVIIVNNFDRVSCPAWFDSPRYAGFDNSLDSGVPYIRDISYIGEMYQIRRDMPWTDDDNPGFGASYSDFAGGTVAGNTFDYPYVHGKAVMRAGYPFYSVSADAFENDPALSEAAWSADIICGKQVTTMIGRGAVPDRYSIFPIRMQEAISGFTESGLQWNLFRRPWDTGGYATTGASQRRSRRYRNTCLDSAWAAAPAQCPSPTSPTPASIVLRPLTVWRPHATARRPSCGTLTAGSRQEYASMQEATRL